MYQFGSCRYASLRLPACWAASFSWSLLTSPPWRISRGRMSGMSPENPDEVRAGRRKSSVSGLDSNGVEVAYGAGVRDSKNPNAGYLAVQAYAYRALMSFIQQHKQPQISDLAPPSGDMSAQYVRDDRICRGVGGRWHLVGAACGAGLDREMQPAAAVSVRESHPDLASFPLLRDVRGMSGDGRLVHLRDVEYPVDRIGLDLEPNLDLSL